jgi:hypothetical protein
MADNLRKTFDNLLQSAAERQRQLSMGILRKKPKNILESPRTWLVYLRQIGFVAFALSIGAILMETHFTYFIGFVYAALLISIIDSILEKPLGKFRFVLAASYLSIIIFVTWGIVFVKAPVEIQVAGIPGDYPLGTTIAGINWNPAYSDIRISLTNQGHSDYLDFDMKLVVDGYIIEAVLQNDFAGCSLMSTSPVVEMHLSGTDPKTGLPFQQPFIPIGKNAPRRLRCDKLPSKVLLTIVVAVANLDFNFAHATTSVLPDAFYGPKRMPKWVTVSGTYKVGLKPYELNQKISVNVER